MNDFSDKLQTIISKASLTARRGSLSKIKSKDISSPAAYWTTHTRIGSGVGDALSVVLATIGCSHARSESGGCTMCSYILDGSGTAVPAESIINQFTKSMEALETKDAPLSVKLYTSGSFFDPEEVPLSARQAILDTIAQDKRVREVVLESRPEYVTSEVVSKVRATLGDRIIELGVGLESSDDTVRSLCINKGFSLSDFKTALDTAKTHGIGIRSYVLIKPPFLTERDALDDSMRTIETAANMGVTTISVNPVNIQRNTLVERIWKRGQYRPPWLWTVVEILRVSRSQIAKDVNIICDPVAAGKPRGPHNCGNCDAEFVRAIRLFSLNQDVDVFNDLDCECKTEWQHSLEHEDFALIVHSNRTHIR